MTAGAEAAAAAAAIANAIKASGAIIRVEPDEFQKIASRISSPLIVSAEGGWMRKNFQYLTAYKGLIFFTKSTQPILFGLSTEFIKAGTIWVPN